MTHEDNNNVFSVKQTLGLDTDCDGNENRYLIKDRNDVTVVNIDFTEAVNKIEKHLTTYRTQVLEEKIGEVNKIEIYQDTNPDYVRDQILEILHPTN